MIQTNLELNVKFLRAFGDKTRVQLLECINKCCPTKVEPKNLWNGFPCLLKSIGIPQTLELTIVAV